MRILQTGMTGGEANASKKKSPHCLTQFERTYAKAGVEMEWRPVVPGRVSEFDGISHVLVAGIVPRTLGAQYAFGAIWAAWYAIQNGIPLVWYNGDFKYRSAISEYRSIANAGEKYILKKVGGSYQYTYAEEASTVGKAIMEFCRWYETPGSPFWEKAVFLIPRYQGIGFDSRLQPLFPGPVKDVNLASVDPMPLLLEEVGSDGKLREFTRTEWAERREAWLLAALNTWDNWIEKQALRWPVEMLGQRTRAVRVDRVSEAEVFKRQTLYQGALAPDNSGGVGSGWWRARWVYAAIQQVFLGVDPLDAEMMLAANESPGYVYTPQRFERATLELRHDMAKSQQFAFADYIHTDWHTTWDELRGAFRLAETLS